MFESILKPKIKRVVIVLFLFFYIDLIHIINDFLWDKANNFAVIISHAEVTENGPVIPFWAAMIPISLVALATIIFVVLLFATYFYFQDDIDVEEAKILLIISAFLVGIKKVFCLHCMLMGSIATLFFLIPGLFGVSAASFIAKLIKRVKSE
jgi:hypothetical protein